MSSHGKTFHITHTCSTLYPSSVLIQGAAVVKKKDRYPYRKQLMLSEWLVDKPADFEKDWLAVIVPVGRRSLVVAARQTTYAYSRSGAVLKHFHSLLPGGSIATQKTKPDYSILDCIFHEGSQTYYILDVMCWRGYPVYDSGTEFRVYWKQQKYEACDGISTYSRGNPLPFQNLPFHACTRESLERVLADTPPFQVDGVLFIHKQCRYIIGVSPLVLWLKPQMIPDLLGIPVSSEFLAQSSTVSTPKRAERKMETTEEGKEEGKGEEEGKVGKGKEEERKEGASEGREKGRRRQRSGKKSKMETESADKRALDM